MPCLIGTKRITLLTVYGYKWLNTVFQQISDWFNNTFPNREPISKSTLTKTVQCFEETDIVADHPCTGKPKTATNYEKSLGCVADVCWFNDSFKMTLVIFHFTKFLKLYVTLLTIAT